MPLTFVGNRKVVLHVVAVMMATEFCRLPCSSPVLARAGLQRDGSDSEERQAGGGFCVQIYSLVTPPSSPVVGLTLSMQRGGS